MEVGVSTIGYGHDSGGLNFVCAASTVDTCVGSRAHVCFGSVQGSLGSVLVSLVQCDGQVCLAITDMVSFRLRWCIPKQYLWEVGQKAGVCLREISPISSVRVRCKNLEDQAGMSMGRCTSGGV